MVAAAAGLWGTLGLLFKILHDEYGIAVLTLAFLRAGGAFVILFTALALLRPSLLRVNRNSLVFFAIYGLCGVSAFYVSYIQAVVLTSVTTGVVLLYTAPAFVTVLAWRIWHESLGARKLAALGLAFSGCALVARAYDPTQLSVNLIGLGFGIAAGFTYALYTIFSKSALERHASWTALAYALFFGALFLLPLQSWDSFAPLRQPGAWIFVVALAAGPTLGSLALYNAGLRRVPASNASVVATIEPVVASVLAFLVLGERLELLQLIGGALAVAGAVWLSAGKAQAGKVSAGAGEAA